MAQVFIRIELRGAPTAATYEALHAYMAHINWWPNIIGTKVKSILPFAMYQGKSALPHAMYQGNYDGELSDLVTALQSDIQANIWTKAVVLAIHSSNWAMVA